MPISNAVDEVKDSIVDCLIDGEMGQDRHLLDNKKKTS